MHLDLKEHLPHAYCVHDDAGVSHHGAAEGPTRCPQ